LIFFQALINHNIPAQVQRNGGPKERLGGGTGYVCAIEQKVTAVTGAFDALFVRMPDGSAP
jgi:hypothetical protein